jgi:hypothetical protein
MMDKYLFVKKLQILSVNGEKKMKKMKETSKRMAYIEIS